jgi:hypothetical protein
VAPVGEPVPPDSALGSTHTFMTGRARLAAGSLYEYEVVAEIIDGATVVDARPAQASWTVAPPLPPPPLEDPL